MFDILILIFLTLLEGFFVAAEIALVSIRRSRVEQLVEEGNAGARRVRRLLEEPGRFLAVSQLGLMTVVFGVGTPDALLAGLTLLIGHAHRSAIRHGEVPGELIVVVVRPHLQSERDLFQVVHALRSASRFPSRLYRRQQQRDQYADDGDHDQELYQRKTLSRCQPLSLSAFHDVRPFLVGS